MSILLDTPTFRLRAVRNGSAVLTHNRRRETIILSHQDDAACLLADAADYLAIGRTPTEVGMLLWAYWARRSSPLAF